MLLWIILTIYVLIALLAGHAMAGVTYKPTLLTQLRIRALAFLWPLWPILMITGAWASK